MDSFDNIFSTIDDSNSHIDDNWLLNTSNSSLIPIQYQQQQFNDNILGHQTIIETDNININDTISQQQQQPIIDISNNNNAIDYNQQIKEQLSLLKQQQENQQIQIQQQLINFQVQQTYQQFLQEPISHIISTINNDYINPISDQQTINSMNEQQTTTTTTTSTTNIDTTKEGKKNRIENKFYHRKHREKKKGYVKEIEDKIAALSFENQQISKENQKLRQHGESVENMLPCDESLQLCGNAINLTIKMKESLDNNDERSLIYLLNQFHSSFSKIVSIALSDVEKLLHPNFQVLLNVISYVPDSIPKIYNIVAGPDSDEWLNKFKIEAELTNEQSLKLEELRLHYRIIDDQYLVDRLELDKEVKKLFNTNLIFLPKNPLELQFDDLPYPIDISNASISNSPSMNYGQSLEIVCKLNSLKNKVFQNRILLLEIYVKLREIFTVRQEALFYIRINLLVSFEFPNFAMLNNIWKGVMPSKSIFNIVENLEKILNDHNHTSSGSSRISLKPATFNIPPNK